MNRRQVIYSFQFMFWLLASIAGMAVVALVARIGVAHLGRVIAPGVLVLASMLCVLCKVVLDEVKSNEGINQFGQRIASKGYRVKFAENGKTMLFLRRRVDIEVRLPRTDAFSFDFWRTGMLRIAFQNSSIPDCSLMMKDSAVSSYNRLGLETGDSPEEIIRALYKVHPKEIESHCYEFALRVMKCIAFDKVVVRDRCITIEKWFGGSALGGKSIDSFAESVLQMLNCFVEMAPELIRAAQRSEASLDQSRIT